MEMTSGAAAAAVVPKLADDPPAAAADHQPWPWPWPWPGREKTTSRRVLLVGSVTTLLLLACFLLVRESVSAYWLQFDIAKLTPMNNGRAELTKNDGPRPSHGRDELLGGLLPAGMPRRSCRSRYQSWRYYKHFPYAASPHLVAKLRAYEARHRRCARGTPLYAASVEQLRSGRSAAANQSTEYCSYVVWLPFDGLGNRMLSMTSAFLYALLTDRVLLAALPPDSADLFCEPFPGATWALPAGDGDEFPVADLVPRGQDMERSYTRLVESKLVGPDANATAAVPAYVYVSLGWQLKDPIFFCGEHQAALAGVNWVLLYSDLYFAPSLYAVAEFQDELRRLFPAKESAHHLLARYLFHPSNAVWGLVTRYYHAYLAPATRRIGVQVRMFSYGSISADDMYGQILACDRQEHILPETDDDDGDDDKSSAAKAPTTSTGDNDDDAGKGASSNSTTAILVASLYADYYERLRSRYYEHAAKGGETVAVLQPTHEGRQATDDAAHNRRALAEIFLLAFSDELVTSGRSTFGYVSSSLAGVRPAILLTAFDHRVPDPPCRRAVSMEPCNLTPPQGVECRSKPPDEDDLARHVRVCEDSGGSVKFFD